MLNERNTLLEDDGIEEEILVEEECSVAQAMWGDIGGNIENQTDLQNALDAKQDSLTEAQLNAVNSGITSEKVTTYDGYADQIASKADQSALNAESTARGEADMALGTRIDNEALARQSVDNGLQTQIDAITSKSDVVDVVANYAALQAYDTSTLGNNDVVKVLDDETHEDALTYYRWSTTTQTWSYIGQEAPYYSKGQMDVKLAEKQDKLTAGANIQIQNGTISATDTTYTAGNGLNLNGTEFSADTTVLATKEDLEDYYTKTEADNLLAPKLEAEVVTELPTTGTEGKLYLTPKAHTTSTATGNPITATVAEEAGSMESFQLDGDTFQQTYTGKNLYNKANYLDGVYINASTGAVGSGSGFVTIYAQISPSTQYTVSKLSTSRFIIAESSSIPAVGDTLNVLSATAQTSEVKTITTSANVAYLEIMVKSSSDTLTIEQILDSIQIEAGSTATSYEPFVGGQPSPSPDYPQPIQTVTGTQTVEIVGKNLLPTYVGLRTVEVSGAELRFDSDGDKVVLNSDYSAQTASAGQQIEITTGDIRRWAWTTIGALEAAPDRRITPNGGEYTVSMRVSSGEWSGNSTGSLILIIGIADDSTGTIRLANKILTTTGTPGPYNVTQSISLGDNEHIRNIAFYTQNIAFNNAELTVQLEKGSTATAYEPYSKQNYPLDLGSIELCKLDTYQDYIYKDGDDWKVHKAVEKLQLVSSQGWAKSSTMTTLDRYFIRGYFPSGTIPSDISAVVVQSNYFTAISQSASDGGAYGICQLNGTGIMINTTLGAFSSNDAFKNWLDSNSVNAYYALSTPTDTAITDTTLITQLEVIRTAALQNGANTITNSATGSNLAGDMEIGYYGYNPTNRYDKWLWLDLNNNYEQIGS